MYNQSKIPIRQPYWGFFLKIWRDSLIEPFGSSKLMPWLPLSRMFWRSHFRTFIPPRCREGTWTCLQHPMWSPVPHLWGINCSPQSTSGYRSPAMLSIILEIRRDRLVELLKPFKMMHWSPGLQTFWLNHLRTTFPGCDVAMSRCCRTWTCMQHLTRSPSLVPTHQVPSPINSSPQMSPPPKV